MSARRLGGGRGAPPPASTSVGLHAARTTALSSSTSPHASSIDAPRGSASRQKARRAYGEPSPSTQFSRSSSSASASTRCHSWMATASSASSATAAAPPPAPPSAPSASRGWAEKLARRAATLRRPPPAAAPPAAAAAAAASPAAPPPKSSSGCVEPPLSAATAAAACREAAEPRELAFRVAERGGRLALRRDARAQLPTELRDLPPLDVQRLHGRDDGKGIAALNGRGVGERRRRWQRIGTRRRAGLVPRRDRRRLLHTSRTHHRRARHLPSAFGWRRLLPMLLPLELRRRASRPSGSCTGSQRGSRLTERPVAKVGHRRLARLRNDRPGHYYYSSVLRAWEVGAGSVGGRGRTDRDARRASRSRASHTHSRS